MTLCPSGSRLEPAVPPTLWKDALNPNPSASATSESSQQTHGAPLASEGPDVVRGTPPWQQAHSPGSRSPSSPFSKGISAGRAASTSWNGSGAGPQGPKDGSLDGGRTGSRPGLLASSLVFQEGPLSAQGQKDAGARAVFSWTHLSLSP